MERIIEWSDHIATTYCSLTEDFQMKPADAVSTDLATLIEQWHGKPVELNEVGYSSSPGCGGSPAGQARFVEALFDAWDANHNAIHTVSLFAWTDFAPALVNTLAGYYRINNPAFRDFLGGLGLRDHCRHLLVGQPMRTSVDRSKNPMTETKRCNPQPEVI
jgi:hypothetical protein